MRQILFFALLFAGLAPGQDLQLPTTRLILLPETEQGPRSISAHLKPEDARKFDDLLTQGSPRFKDQKMPAMFETLFDERGKFFATADTRVALVVDERFSPPRSSLWYFEHDEKKYPRSTVLQRTKLGEEEWILVSFVEAEAKTLYEIMAVEARPTTLQLGDDKGRIILEKHFEDSNGFIFVSCWTSEDQSQPLISLAQGSKELESVLEFNHICHVGFLASRIEDASRGRGKGQVPPAVAPRPQSDEQLMAKAKLLAARQMLNIAPTNTLPSYSSVNPGGAARAASFRREAWFLSWVGREEALVQWAETQPRGYGSGVDQRFSTWAGIYDRHVAEEFRRLKAQQQSGTPVPVPLP